MAHEEYHPSVEAPTDDSSSVDAEKWRNDQKQLRASGSRNLANSLGRMSSEQREEIAGLLTPGVALSPSESLAVNFEGEYSRGIVSKQREVRSLMDERSAALKTIEGLNTADDLDKLAEAILDGDPNAIGRSREMIFEEEVKIIAREVVAKQLSEVFGVPEDELMSIVDQTFVDRLGVVVGDRHWINTNENVHRRAVEIVANELKQFAAEHESESKAELIDQPHDPNIW